MNKLYFVMIFVVMFLISLVSVCVKADLIISVAAKQSRTVHTTTTNTEATSHTIEPLTKHGKHPKKKHPKHPNTPPVNTPMPPKGTKEYYASDYSSDSQDTTSESIDLGVLVQYSHCSGVTIGVGMFQDETGMATLGWRFE